MWRWMGAFLSVVALASCQRGDEGGGPAPRDEAPGTPLAERARAGYAAERMPGPETSIGRGLTPGDEGTGGGDLDARLEQAEAAARTPVTEPVAVTGRVTGKDSDSFRLETSSGDELDVLVPLPQQAYRSGLAIGSPGELAEGDEVRVTYRMSEGKAVADRIEVTRPAGTGQGSGRDAGTTEPEGRGSGEQRPGTLGSGIDD